ncbi:MAG: hypothetical protein AB7T38_18725 [Nitrospirales bacterium]
MDPTPLSQLLKLIAEEIRSLVKKGHIEEAMEADDVGRRLDNADPFPPFEASNDPHRVQSAIIWEAAKVMAEEGEPATAVRLVKEVKKQKPH